MLAQQGKLEIFYNGQKTKYAVPFFQRPYVWNEDNWEVLWDHISEIDSLGNGHFVGMIVTKQVLTHPGEEKRYLIDGQQRLTTFSLLLKAIATKATCKGEFLDLREETNRLLLLKNTKGEKSTRLEHSKNDKSCFEAVMLDKDLSNFQEFKSDKTTIKQSHKILECYKYFLNKLEGYTDEQLDRLRDVILNKVDIVSMVLTEEDKEQEIFDTINSLGIILTTAELLKNFIFSDSEIKDSYNEYWESVFECDEEQVAFWSKKKTSGRIIRNNIEVLLYCYLIIQKKNAVELEKLFAEYKIWLQGKTTKDKIAFLEELKEYATIFISFPEGAKLNEIAFSQEEERFFHIIENLEITTVFPLILFIYKQVPDKNTRLQLLKILESYLVRRNVCRLTTKNYNHLFIQIINKLIEAKVVTVDTFKAILISFTDDTNKFPSDSEFETAFLEEAISNANAREILFCISLYQIDNTKSDINKLTSSYSLEHMMPQKWEENWNKDGMNELEKVTRNKKLKTLGNLTLVTNSLNSAMKNAAWDKKKKALKEFSRLKITTDYVDNSEWNEIEIKKRAENLSSEALEMWKDLENL